MKVLFLYLKAFSFTGGIEKFNRSLLKALHELSVDGHMDADAISAYDPKPDEKYFPVLRFTGHGGGRPLFVLNALYQAMKYNTVILGHINLAIVGNLIKLCRPSVRLIVIVHGIEVWYTLTGHKKRLLDTADVILSVSNFTKEKILEFNPSVLSSKIRIFPNTIDPYFMLPVKFDKPSYLMDRYGLNHHQQVLLTVTRLADSEKYKGYDNVISSIPSIKKKVPALRYLIGGKADSGERQRVEKLIEHFGVCDSVSLLGFIDDAELIDHYLLADIFVLQSRKEGFGIVFIEALACGRKVIAGSRDGSVEALMQGELGKLIDPDDQEGLTKSIVDFLQTQDYSPQLLQKKVHDAFGFHRYKERLKVLLLNTTH